MTNLPSRIPLLSWWWIMACMVATYSQAANVTWEGSVDSDWHNGANWDNDTGPAAGDVLYIREGTIDFTEVTDYNLRALRLEGGIVSFISGLFKSSYNPSWDSHVEGTVHHTGAEVQINELEVGRTQGDTGNYYLKGGMLRINRGLAGYSIHLGSNKSSVNAGTGNLEISGGELTTRSGIKLGDDTLAGTGKFAVLGSEISQVGIGASTGDTDGNWHQYAGSTLQAGISKGGIRTIFLHDSASDDSGTSATFENGTLLDVGYHGNGYGGGTWTVLEVENGDITNNGLAFAPGVDTEIWSFNIDNSGANGRLQVSAVGDPAGIDLNVGNTKKQKMRYGMDYERLWYWTTSLSAAEKDLVAKWSVVDCNIDFIRVAIDSGYELTEGTFDLSAYTKKILPMMQDMKDANPNIKFFASPRPLNEVEKDAKWQPYPRWITGDANNNGNFDFDWQKCAEYLERYILLMKSNGHKISFMDLTNEWQNNSGGRITTGDARDIVEYLKDRLDPEDMPLTIAPSSWNFSQGASWINSLYTTRRRDAIDIAGAHNTDKTGPAQDFADKVR